jgi:hypothetical protein
MKLRHEVAAIRSMTDVAYKWYARGEYLYSEHPVLLGLNAVVAMAQMIKADLLRWDETERLAVETELDEATTAAESLLWEINDEEEGA